VFTVHSTSIPGCLSVKFRNIPDNRGSFVKTFHENSFRDLNLSFTVKEEYFSYSKQNVFRGMHFQLPPTPIDKVVFCVSGKVRDYVVDLRKGSPAFGKFLAFDLDENEPQAIIIPVGLAHGFYVQSEYAIMQYKVSDVFDPATDAGIHYSSFDFAREIINPIMSERDKNFDCIKEFDSPFIY
jgi:dTDP-4-dehydrorhamnose 3,5-epimerase